MLVSTSEAIMTAIIGQFARDDRGGVLVAAAGFITVSVMAIGAAIAYSQASDARTSYQRALDAAVMPGAWLPTSATASERIAAPDTTFQGSLSEQARRATSSRSATFQVS